MWNPTTKRLAVLRANGCVLCDGKARIRRGLANIRNATGFDAARDVGRFAPRYTRISPATP
ncbi:hypothetical protein EGT41_22785 [Burkholderia cenocepacia]|uniref:Uncharacterized protein n=1 Tax=Burkholderia cenocepacia TaxID=95486 RepID=A0A3R9BEV6_9BURK|nr:hypothetical protein EGT41_22785 [Burkholderia cenocepacia]